MSSDQETFRKLAIESRFLEEAANELQSRINMTNAALAELRVSNMTLEGLEKENKNAQLFIPIGGGSYIKARLENAKKVIVGIGGDVAVEKSVKETKGEFQTRISELEKTRDALGQQFNQVIEKIQENRGRIESVSAKLREGEKASRVRKAKKGT